MNNVEMAGVFSRIGDLLEVKGENPYKIQAYRRAAETLVDLPEPAPDLLRRGVKIPGVGDAISAKIEEMEATGHLRFYENLVQEVPVTLIEVLRVPGVGPQSVRVIRKALGISSLDELEAAANDGRLAAVKGIGPRRAETIRANIVEVRQRTDRAALGQALQLADRIERALLARPEVGRVEVAGSLRRLCESVGDVDLVVTSEAPLRTVDAFCSLPIATEVVDRGAMEASIIDPDRLRADLLAVPPESFGAALLFLTGSREFNEWLRARAAARGLTLTERGLFPVEGGAAIAGATEADIFAALDVPPVPPEVREASVLPLLDRGETPPRLDLADLRGDLHSHTNWSDGTATLEAMAEAARARGLRYLAVTDHSRGLGMTGGLTEERLREQTALIRQLNARWDPAEFQLLAGTEMEIRGDGSLDFADEALAELDFVIASVHSAMRQDRDTMTERLLRAIRSPWVSMIGHPSGRLIARRAGYDFDREAVFRAAAETGTALEINAHWARLDLSDADAALARDLGVTLAINSDAHDPGGFDVLRFGIGTARRAWLAPENILNTRDLGGIKAFVARKREREK